MKPEDISVELRLVNLEKTKAFVDVTLPLGGDGVAKLSGWSVIQTNGQPPRVVPPARKGKYRYFDVVALIGKIHSLVDEAVLREFERQTKARRD